jgi:hypothetical protein
MTGRVFTWAFDAFVAVTISVFLSSYIAGTEPIHSTIPYKLGVIKNRVADICLGTLLYASIKWLLLRLRESPGRKGESIYGLQHGRLHLHVPTSMWMNMGYWDVDTTKTLAKACRDLLKAVLIEAGFGSETEGAEMTKDARRPKMLIDLGCGCGDQTIYLMSKTPVRPCDRNWWDDREHCVQFDHYVGITKDPVQARYALKRVNELEVIAESNEQSEEEKERPDVTLFCGNAATPASWNKQIQKCIESTSIDDSERWVLALDTAYHFSPSRWPVIKHAYAHLHASFMAFDLCLSPKATLNQKLTLRILTTLMGAPWANFVTPDDYRQKLVQAGYANDAIKIVDISQHVFTPLAQYLDEQDTRLKTLGLGIGSFNVAKSLFRWWGQSGVVRGVIIVARR